MVASPLSLGTTPPSDYHHAFYSTISPMDLWSTATANPPGLILATRHNSAYVKHKKGEYHLLSC